MEAGEIVNGKYEIVRLLGAGGMGSVYKAKAGDTGSFVALKVINSGDLAKNPVLIARFQREAKAASAIETEHIVQVVDAGLDETSGMPFMAMELLEGEDTQQLIDRLTYVPPMVALELAAQACLGLQKAHEATVVHRDIKPANLFLAKRPSGADDDAPVVVKLLDFGVAKIKQDQANNAETAGLTRTGSMLGSPLYMSPEQARGHKTIDHRADIWSLGVVLYQMLTARTPHHDIEALGELIIAICSDVPRSVQDFAPWVGPEITAVVHRALRFDPGDRYQSAAEMAEAIRALLPKGFEVHASQLVPMAPEERRVVAPKASVAALEGTRPPSPSTMPPEVVAPKAGVDESGPNPLPGVRAGAPPAPVAAGTTHGVAGESIPPQRSSVWLTLVAGAVTLVVLSVIALIRALASEPEPERPAASASAAPRPPPPAPPSVGPTASAKTSAPAASTTSAPALAPKTVKLVVVPQQAKVEVEGVVVSSKAGIVEITGPLGSKHKVRVTLGGRFNDKEVVITEDGAVPPTIELPAAKPDASASAAPPPPPAGDPPPPPAPPPPSDPFDEGPN